MLFFFEKVSPLLCYAIYRLYWLGESFTLGVYENDIFFGGVCRVPGESNISLYFYKNPKKIFTTTPHPLNSRTPILNHT